MQELEQAVELLLSSVSPVTETELVPLDAALGRVLAEDCIAPQDYPPFPRSPLDGYAVRGADTAGASRETPVSLRVIGKIFAGEVFSGTVGPGEAVRIMTGAPIPEGADTVVRQEDTDYGTEVVSLYSSVSPCQNYCPAGEYYKTGDRLLKKGCYLNAIAVRSLAELGLDRVQVYELPRIAVISTGDEVTEPGVPLAPGKIYDSNRFFLTNLLTELGCAPVESLHCGDDAELLAGEIRRLSERCQLILTTGGVSVGEKDILHRTVELLGAQTLFWKVAVKPGSPTLAAKYQNTLLLCLSGNPNGAAVHFELLARPVLAKLTGSPLWGVKRRRAVLSEGYPKGSKMRRLLRGTVDGHRVHLARGDADKGVMTALVESNCLVELPPRPDGFPSGTEVWVYCL